MAYLPERDGDTRIVFMDPSRTARVLVTDWLHYKASPRIFDQSVFEITVPHTSAVWSTTYSSATAASTYWATWSFDFWFRGVKKFSGPVCAGDIDETGAIGRDGKPVAFATLRCCSWFTWFLSGRTVQTGTGASYSQSAQPWDNIMRDLVRKNATSSYVTPPSYPGGVSRANFGPFTLTVEADTSTASSGSFKLQTGKSLLDNVAELGTMQSSTADYLWPYVEESGTPGTFTFKVLVGRSGGSRAIGSDKTASVTVSPAMGTVRNAKIAFDHLHVLTTAGATGTKRETNRRRSWVHDSTLATTFGVREDEINLPAAANSYERDAEAYRALADANADTTRTYQFIVNETSLLRYALDYNEKDSITAVVGSTGEVSTRMIVGADIEATAPNASVVQLMFGRYPSNPVRDAQRSGGGGRGGGRRNGGKPRDGDGQSEVDPDLIYTWAHLTAQYGTTSMDADQYDDTLAFAGRDTATYVRVRTYGTDTGTGSATTEKIEDLIVGTPTVSGDIAADAYILIRGDDGFDYKLLAKKATSSPTP